MHLSNLKKYSEQEFAENEQRIGLFIKGMWGHYAATAHIRLLQIFDVISKDMLFNPCIIDFDELDYVKNDMANNNFLLDVVIIQRDVLDSVFSKKLIKYCKQFGIKIIYEIDDDLLNIDQSHPEYEYYLKSAEIIKFILKNSNVVTVSTEKLKDKLKSFTDNIVVIKNTLISKWNEGSVFLHNGTDSKLIKIGYMGTITHENDIKIIEKCITNVKNYFNKQNIPVEFEFIGGSRRELNSSKQIKVPAEAVIYPDFINWLKKIVDWDIAIAPLENNPINDSKSEIKYLEYTALGLPGIYSAVGSYKEVIEDGVNGILIYDNTEESWTNNIINLIENKNLQIEILKNSSSNVIKDYSMDNAVNFWKKILNDNKRDKNSLLYNKIKKFKELDLNMSFNEFLISESYDIIKNSELFDFNWYLNEYEDVKYNELDPIWHYLRLGVYEQCKPNSEFDEFNHDFFGLNPFVKYILYGDL